MHVNVYTYMCTFIILTLGLLFRLCIQQIWTQIILHEGLQYDGQWMDRKSKTVHSVALLSALENILLSREYVCM